MRTHYQQASDSTVISPPYKAFTLNSKATVIRDGCCIVFRQRKRCNDGARRQTTRGDCVSSLAPPSRCFVFLGAERCIMFSIAWLSFRLLCRQNSIQRSVMAIFPFDEVSDINYNVRCRNLLNRFVNTSKTWVSVFFPNTMSGKKPEKTVFFQNFRFFSEPSHHYLRVPK